MARFVIVILTIWILPDWNLYSQNLRDSTRIVNASKLYPESHQIFNYFERDQMFELSFDNIFGIPEIEVEINNNNYQLFLDFGNKGYYTLTNHLGDLGYEIIDITKTYNPDGSYRGESVNIRLPLIKIFHKEYRNIPGSLTEWSIYASAPFSGMVGLNFLEDKYFTIDYKKKLLGISQSSMTDFLDSSYELIQLHTFDYHPLGVHCNGKINGRECIIYIDTGKSVTMVDKNILPPDKLVSNKRGTYYTGTVLIQIGRTQLNIHYPRVKEIKRSLPQEYEVGVEIGSDVLRHLLISLDRTSGKNHFIIHH